MIIYAMIINISIIINNYEWDFENETTYIKQNVQPFYVNNLSDI